VTFVSPHTTQLGTENFFINWQDGVSSNPRIIVAPAQNTTYTANFQTQYQVTVAASPAAGGTVTGGGWYASGTTATITAVPASGYQFANWNFNSSVNPTLAVNVSSAQTVTANFRPITSAVPGNYNVTQILNGTTAAINNSGQVVGYSYIGGFASAFLWTPTTPNGNIGNAVDIGGLAASGTGSNYASALNDSGEVAGYTSTGLGRQAFLWTPSAPNGSTGTATVFLANAANVLGINATGQIAGTLTSPYLWSPSVPQGSTGTANTDSRFAGITGINDYGQAIMNSGGQQQILLFTPSVPNGASGTFTSISGLPGSSSNYAVAINRNGAIVGYSEITDSTGNYQVQTFVWTPGVPNGPTGSTVEIPIPAGFSSITPTAINATGQVVGYMNNTTSSYYYYTPFLYTGGVVYDLTSLSSSLSGYYQPSINDHGQILIGQYLLTPGMPPPTQSAGTVPITITSSLGRDFTVTGANCSAGSYATPQVLYWMPGASCTVSFLSPHTNQIGTRWSFSSWQDGSNSNPRVFTAPAQATTYNALFTAQYLVVTSASPPQGGTISGGGWYNSGATATITATPANGYRLLDWTSNTMTVTVNYAQSVTVNFGLLSAIPPNNYGITPISTYARAGAGKPLNNYGQVVGQSAYYSSSPLLWIPVSANSPVGNASDMGLSLVTYGYPSAINDSGQVVGPGSYSSGAPFLWSPATPNGIAGTVTAFLGNSVSGYSTTINTINSYGQIAGYANGSYFIWTPSTPNGVTGTSNTDSRLSGLVAINDYGQAIGSNTYQASSGTLFTPSAANGASGTYTTITGLAGANYMSMTAINNNGTILGSSCIVPPQSSTCVSHTWLWTPGAPHGTSGTLAEILPPAGYSALVPNALNDSGQVVGTMTRSDGVAVPFFYSGGVIYDLSTLSGSLKGLTPSAINNAGQILLSSGGYSELYLLSPNTAAPAATPGTVAIQITSPTSSNSTTQAFIVSGNGCSSGAYNTPQTLYWTPGASCTVSFVSPHTVIPGTQWMFSSWLDSSAGSTRTFVAPSSPATYSGSFTQQVLITTAANPPAGGTISGGGWVNYGSSITLTATPASGYRLIDLGGAVPNTANPNSMTFTAFSPQTIAADFAPIGLTPPNNYTSALIASGTAGSVKPINNFGQVVGYSGTAAFVWTPLIANSSAGNLTQVTGIGSQGNSDDSVSAINSQGQIVGTTAGSYCCGGGQPFLWSPAAPNGPMGTSVTMPGFPSTTSGLDINDYGEVSGSTYSAGYLWVPSIANAIVGTINNDARINGIARINNLGQAIINNTNNYPPSVDQTLFTPTPVHSSNGNFTFVFGLPGATTSTLVDINASGAIVGTSCIPATTSQTCANHMFLWTPSTPNGATGTAVEIVPPAGFASVTPTAINAAGQIVGTMGEPGNLTLPFLYTGGAIYDLSLVNSAIRTGTPYGINDRGQIVVGTGSNIYLLTPQLTLPPLPAAINPGSGSGSSTVLTFTFTDPRGWQDLDVVDIVINNFLDGRGACYLAYSRSLNVLYLVNDAGTALLPGLSNSQCSVSISGSVSGNGNTLTLPINFIFSPTFGGNKVIYVAARDTAQNNSGWQALGTWGVPGVTTSPTAAVSVAPGRGSGMTQTFAFTFSDTKGWQDLGVVDILINNFLDGRNACYIAYSRPYNTLYLVNDAGTALLPGLSNSQCSVSMAGAAAGSSNTLTLTLNITFSSSFDGNRVIYTAARDFLDANTSGWQALGSWTVQ
jgi:probable HAF family extracellular repeat protein